MRHLAPIIVATTCVAFLAGCATQREDVPRPPVVEPSTPVLPPQKPPVAAAPATAPAAPAGAATTPPPKPIAERPAPRTFATLKPGTTTAEITVDRQKRSYALHVPKGYDPAKAVPLVVVLHARGSSAKGASVYGFDAKADRTGFAVVYPEALGQPQVWNAVHDRGTSGANDVEYVLAAIDAVAADVNVDPRRVYVVGSSSGAMMAYRLAAEHPQRFAAIAVFAGSIGTRNPKGVLMQVPRAAEPVSVLHVHGRADRTVPYAGGKSVTLPGATYVGAAESVRFWADVDGCEAQAATTTAGPVTREVWTKCRGDARVELVSIDKQSHTWPQSVRLDPKRPAQSMADVVWDFFRARARP
jgi:polyhydroxybutyrate depolymerase